MNTVITFTIVVLLCVAAWFAWKYFAVRRDIDQYSSQVRIQDASTDIRELGSLSSAITSMTSTLNVELSRLDAERARLPARLSLSPISRMGLLVEAPQATWIATTKEINFHFTSTWLEIPYSEAGFLRFMDQVITLLELQHPLPPESNVRTASIVCMPATTGCENTTASLSAQSPGS